MWRGESTRRLFVKGRIAMTPSFRSKSLPTRVRRWHLLLSIVFKGHSVSLQGWLGLCLASGGILLEVVHKVRSGKKAKSECGDREGADRQLAHQTRTEEPRVTFALCSPLMCLRSLSCLSYRLTIEHAVDQEVGCCTGVAGGTPGMFWMWTDMHQRSEDGAHRSLQRGNSHIWRSLSAENG